MLGLLSITFDAVPGLSADPCGEKTLTSLIATGPPVGAGGAAVSPAGGAAAGVVSPNSWLSSGASVLSPAMEVNNQ